MRLVRIPVARVALREDLGYAGSELALLARLDMAGDPLGRGGALRGGGVRWRTLYSLIDAIDFDDSLAAVTWLGLGLGLGLG